MIVPSPGLLWTNLAEADEKDNGQCFDLTKQTPETTIGNDPDSSVMAPASSQEDQDSVGLPFLSGKKMVLSGYIQLRLQFFRPETGKVSGADIRRIRRTTMGCRHNCNLFIEIIHLPAGKCIIETFGERAPG